MNLSLEKESLAVCRLAPDAPPPAWTAGLRDFCSITRTREELSIVCPAANVPGDVKTEAGWRMFKLEGPLDFGLTGILASVLDPLAKARISIFALSTHD